MTYCHHHLGISNSKHAPVILSQGYVCYMYVRQLNHSHYPLPIGVSQSFPVSGLFGPTMACLFFCESSVDIKGPIA